MTLRYKHYVTQTSVCVPMIKRTKVRSTQYISALLLLTLTAFAISCGGSKANVRVESGATPAPAAIEVTTVAAISRQLPRYFEATGSLAGDMQSDVAPQTSGKVSALGVDLGSFVRRGQMIVRL